MKSQMLLPQGLKTVGLVLLVLTILYWVNVLTFAIPELLPLKGGLILNKIIFAGLICSLSLIAFSRKKDEDEYTAAIRNRYLTLAFYIDSQRVTTRIQHI